MDRDDDVKEFTEQDMRSAVYAALVCFIRDNLAPHPLRMTADELQSASGTMLQIESSDGVVSFTLVEPPFKGTEQ